MSRDRKVVRIILLLRWCWCSCLLLWDCCTEFVVIIPLHWNSCTTPLLILRSSVCWRAVLLMLLLPDCWQVFAICSACVCIASINFASDESQKLVCSFRRSLHVFNRGGMEQWFFKSHSWYRHCDQCSLSLIDAAIRCADISLGPQECRETARWWG